MPTYQYVCRKCGHEFEFVQSMMDDALKLCPKERCARKPWARGRVDRQLSGGAGLIFKGSGFYTTDYRSEGYKASAKKESEASAPKKEAESGSPKKDAAAKPETKPASGTPAGGTAKSGKD